MLPDFGLNRTIQDLKKNDQFVFNDQTFTVSRRWIDDDKPLIAYNESKLQEERFYYEGLEIVKVVKPIK